VPGIAIPARATLLPSVRVRPHDLWGSRACLRVFIRLIIAGVMLAFTVMLCMACAPLAGLPIGGALKIAVPASVLGAGLVVYALGAGDRTLFHARAEYKPTVEQLSEELTLASVPEEVAEAVERTVPAPKVVFTASR
jgi:hypothetical protein